MSVYNLIENLSPDGRLPGMDEWTYCADAETDAEGKFTIALPPGRGQVWIGAEGYLTDRDYTELDVRVDGSNAIPNFVTEKLEPIRGQVVDSNGQFVPGAIVRMRWGPLLTIQPVVSGADGKFEIALTRIPLDPQTEQRHYELDIAAFVANQPLSGVTRINLRNTDSLQKDSIVLRRESSPEELLTMDDNLWSLAKKRKYLAEKPEKFPKGNRGQPAPELDGIAWCNTDARSLKDFRGRYVLLDF